ncbi:MAG: DJ-1/PfpI family protein [Anaerovorax sp.]
MKKKILLLLAEGFEFYEASVFIDVMGWNFTVGDRSTKLVTCGVTKEVNSTFNQRMTVDETLDGIDIPSFDALAIPGGFKGYGFYQCAYSDPFLEVIRAFDAQRKLIASVCVGSLPIGKSGILKNREATVYQREGGIYQRALAAFGATVVDAPIVEDGNIITARDPGSGADVAFRLLERLTCRENMERVRHEMGF